MIRAIIKFRIENLWFKVETLYLGRKFSGAWSGRARKSDYQVA
jgi:hypothetical protein